MRNKTKHFHNLSTRELKLKPKHPNFTFWPQSVNSILEYVLYTRGKIYQEWLNLYSTDV